MSRTINANATANAGIERGRRWPPRPVWYPIAPIESAVIALITTQTIAGIRTRLDKTCRMEIDHLVQRLKVETEDD